MVEVLVAPNSTLANTGWFVVGSGSDLHEVINRPITDPDDTSYVQDTANGDSFEVGFPEPVGQGPQVAPLRIRLRARHAGIGVDDPQFFVSLNDGGSEVYASSKIEIPLTGPLNVELDTGIMPGDLSAISVVVLDGAVGGERRFRVYELELVYTLADVETGGGSSASAELAGRGALAGRAGASARADAVASGVGRLAAVGGGASRCFALLTAIGSLAGSAVGGSSSAAVCGGVGELVGIAASTSQAAPLLQGSGRVAGRAGGAGSSVARARGTGSLAGVAFGGSRASIEPTEIASLGIYQKISRLVRQRFQNAIAVPNALPTVYDNARYEPSPTVTWARVRVRCDDAEQIATGAGNRYRKRGAATVSLHVPIGTGVSAASALAIEVQSAFRGASTQHVRFRSPAIRPGERDGAHWRVDVVCPFFADVDLVLDEGATLVSLPNADEAQSIVRARVKALWDGLGYASRFENDPRPTPEPTEIWAHFSIVLGEPRAVELHGGALTYRTVGVAFAMLSFPEGTGEEAALGIGDQLADVLRAVSDRGVTFKTPLVRGTQRQGAGWRVDVRARFFWNQIT